MFNPSTRSSLVFVLAVLTLTACTSGDREKVSSVHGPYLGQQVPGDEPRVFAPGIVSTGLFERDLVITPDGNEIYFCICGPDYVYSTIMVTRRSASGGWSTPEPVSFAAKQPYGDIEPFLAPAGDRLLFVSDRPSPDAGKPKEGHHIWTVDRVGEGWGTPTLLGPPVLAEGDQYFPSLTRDGTLYYTAEIEGKPGNWVFRSRPAGDGWGEPELLPVTVNAGRTRFNACITADESALVLSIVGLPESHGRSDYYVCFRSPADAWSEPVNLGEAINAPKSYGYSPSFSPDGRYFFFMSARSVAVAALSGKPIGYSEARKLNCIPGNGNPDIWWVDAAFLERLRPAAAQVNP